MGAKFNTILQDIDAVIARDPATKSRTEAILCSSGLHSIVVYRFTHWLWNKNADVLNGLCSNGINRRSVFMKKSAHRLCRIGDCVA